MTFLLVISAFGCGWFAAAWFRRRSSPVATAVSVHNEPSGVPDSVVQDLHETRTALADLLSAFEQCESQAPDEEQPLEISGQHWNSLLKSMGIVKELLVISYDQLRKVRAGGPQGREQLNDWIDRRLALLNRYGNSVSIAFVQVCPAGTHGETNRSQDIRGATQVLRDFIRDTDRLFVYSDDEFVVGLPETMMGDTCLFAARCRRTMRERFGWDVRVGVTELFADDNAKTALSRADAALHHSRAQASRPLHSHNGSALEVIPENTDELCVVG
ncbi:MAG: hypothetical protein AAGF97_09745 [Planctomycetota bacterium]